LPNSCRHTPAAAINRPYALHPKHPLVSTVLPSSAVTYTAGPGLVQLGPACRRRITQIGIGCAMDMLRSRRRRAASAGGEVECRGAAESPVHSRNGLEEILHSGSHSVCVCVCACARVRMPLCVCARACVRVCVCIYTRVRARACACVCARACVCVDVVHAHALKAGRMSVNVDIVQASIASAPTLTRVCTAAPRRAPRRCIRPARPQTKTYLLDLHAPARMRPKRT
jgi:hypothetical protein